MFKLIRFAKQLIVALKLAANALITVATGLEMLVGSEAI